MEPVGLSIPATGRALGGEEKPLSRATIYRLIAQHKLKAVKIGGRTLVTVASIRALVDGTS